MTKVRFPAVLRSLSLRSKIVMIGIAQLAVLAGVLFWLNQSQATQDMRAEYISRARSIVLTAESMREEMASKWRLGLFSAHQMVDWGQAGAVEKILGAVPVVTAWSAAMAKAKEGGYEFRVPKFQPRNPQNAPDELETRALTAFHEDATLQEYHEIDASQNAVRYFRPIKLTQECMLCHGEPSSAKELWGNDEGRDPTGAKMEGWEVGQVHGAFEVVQSLDEADARIAAAFRRNLVIVGGLMVVSSGLFFFLITRSITRPIRATVRAFQAFAEGDLTRRLEVTGEDEVGQLCSAANLMVDRLREMIDNMNRCSASLATSSGKLSGTAHQLSGVAGETTQQSGTVAAAAEEMSVNMNTMATSSEQLTTNVRTVAASIEEMTAAIQESSRDAVNAVSHIEEVVAEVNAASRTIASAVEEQSATTKEIAANVAQAANGAETVSSNVCETAAATREVTAAISRVDQNAKRTAEDAEQMRVAGDELEGLSGQLVSMVDQFQM